MPSSTSISRLVAFNPATSKIVWKHDDVSTGGIAAGNPRVLREPGDDDREAGSPSSGGPSRRRSTRSEAGHPGLRHEDGRTWSGRRRSSSNGVAAAVVPRITPYSVNGKEYIVSFVAQRPRWAPDISAFALP